MSIRINLRGRVTALAAALALATCLATCLAACVGQADPPSQSATTAPEPRPLTAEEAQRLSVMRFMNFNASVRSIALEVDEAGTAYALHGWVDFAARLGYAALRSGSDSALVAWTAETIGSHPPVGDEDLPPLPPPVTSADDPDWSTSELAPSASRLHAALAVVLEAGHDRPDNPLLLQQTDARWLRSDEVDGVAVDVVAGPTSDHPFDPATSTGDGSDATIRYWLDHDSVLHRLEVRLGGSGDWTVVDFGDGHDVEFADAFTAETGGG